MERQPTENGRKYLQNDAADNETNFQNIQTVLNSTTKNKQINNPIQKKK